MRPLGVNIVHVAKQLAEKHLQIKIGVSDASLAQLFPESHKHDRFGLIVNEPFGSLGASLLLQAAIVQFFKVAPERRFSAAVYPEIYLFHVGGRHGDHSVFDFWPPRKEVFLADNSPLTVVEALNDRAITRLAIPDGTSGGDTSVFADGPSTWAEQAAARNLLVSCFAYSPEGVTSGADVWLQTSHGSFEENIAATLDIGAVIGSVQDVPPELPGESQPVDNDRWAAIAKLRLGEVEYDYARTIADRRLRSLDGNGLRRESYRRISPEEALSLLTSL